MTERTRRSQRRTEALSRERIVEAAVALLDAAGEDGLTFRALTERLATGPGAVYHHVANRDELLAAATDAVVTAALGTTNARPDDPRDGVRTLALGLFDAIDEHPWLSLQLTVQFSRRPGGPVAPRIFEAIGRRVRALGVPEAEWFLAASTLVYYILGSVGPNTHVDGVEMSRDEFLDATATRWEGLDPEDYPFTRAVADQLRDHDDREQFLGGIDLVLAGIARPGPTSPSPRVVVTPGDRVGR